MKPERWQQIENLFQSALERAPDERAAFLDQACAGDDELRREVESLLAYEEKTGGFIESPALEVAAKALAGDQVKLTAGRLIGHYKILSLLGAGGMGEVYRAKDTRLGREVAVKVLPSAFSADADRLRRFEQEARTAGMLNHSNILIVHDIGTHEGVPYIVSELLEGETLRDRLKSPLPQRKAIDYALQIARGLAVAHEKGIVHRDLKPENLFMTKDGLVKILDFGLAKLTQPKLVVGLGSNAPTKSPQTDPGLVMGTSGYMSPEQVRGQEADHRSDIFAFGIVLYEMLSGKRAFLGESTVETMNAILKEDPPELSEMNLNISPALERVVKHCLEKSPDERFQSARDLAFDLEALSTPSGQSATSKAISRARSERRLLPLLAGLVLLLTVALTAFFTGERAAERLPPSFQRLTFHRGFIHAARFAPDGHTIIYGAAWDGNPTQLFSTNPESPESRPLGFPDADILSLSSSREMAISLGRHNVMPFMFSGTLARVPLAGTAPREVLEDVQWADWSPDGSGLAVVRDVGGRNRLEFPIGKVLYETGGWIGHPRISPKGDLIAFLDHPVRQNDGGSVAVVDLAGNKRTLSSDWLSEWGLAWSPNSDEVWFTATRAGWNRALYAVTLSGKERLLTRMAGELTLNDISRDGRVLMTHSNERLEINCLPPDETKERDLSWLDWSAVRSLSNDGKMLLISESGEGAGATSVSYLRKTDGSPAVRLGEVEPRALSPDGKWVIASNLQSSPVQLLLLPTGSGEPKQLTNDAIQHRATFWFPDGKRFLFIGKEPDHGMRLYVQDLTGGAPRAVTPEGVSTLGITISPDGKFVTAIGPDEKTSLYPVEGGEPRPISGLAVGDDPIQWSADGRSLYLFLHGELPAKIYRLDLSTGRKELWKEFMPSDPAGVEYIVSPRLTPDGKSYAYSYYRNLSDLYLVEGLK